MELQQQLTLAFALGAILISIATLYEVYKTRQKNREIREFQNSLTHAWKCPYYEDCEVEIKTNDKDTLTLLRDSHIQTHHN